MKKVKEKKIEFFVPALALEHKENGEFITKKDKIRAAILRWFLYEDFFKEKNILAGPRLFVVLEEIKFNANSLGYQVRGTISC